MYDFCTESALDTLNGANPCPDTRQNLQQKKDKIFGRNPQKSAIWTTPKGGFLCLKHADFGAEQARFPHRNFCMKSARILHRQRTVLIDMSPISAQISCVFFQCGKRTDFMQKNPLCEQPRSAHFPAELRDKSTTSVKLQLPALPDNWSVSQRSRASPK